jgi:hypothetical protein
MWLIFIYESSTPNTLLALQALSFNTAYKAQRHVFFSLFSSLLYEAPMPNMHPRNLTGLLARYRLSACANERRLTSGQQVVLDLLSIDPLFRVLRGRQYALI